MSKLIRQKAIVDILSTEQVVTQSALTQKLKVRGFDVTTSTVCRDVADLKLLRSPRGYMLRCWAEGYGASAVTDRKGRLGHWIVDIELATNFVIIKTIRGMAKKVAITIENAQLPGLIGAVARNETVLLVTRSINDACELKSTLRKMLATGYFKWNCTETV